jgi:raffinose/stachyose/melibiose transport system permease protein
MRIPAFIRTRPFLLFILPGFLLYGAFVILPLINTVYYSFFDWNGIGAMEYEGLDNYARILFGDRMPGIVFNALWNNIKYVLCVLFIITPVQLFFAYMIYIRIPGHKAYQMLIFLPFVLSKAIVGFFSMIVFDPNIGILNSLFRDLGLEQLTSAWFGDPNKAFPLFVGTIMWQGLGVGMLIFLANLKGLPEDVLEQSVIDGTNGRQRFFRIVLPMIVPAITNVVVLSTIFALTIFELPYILGGPNGGVNNSLDFMNLVFYRYTFSGIHGGGTDVGLGASIISVLFVFVFVVAMLQLTVLNRIDVEQ